MRAVRYRVRCILRARWRATFFLALVVAAASAAVLTLAAGAARTATAPDRYTAAHGGGHDGTIQQGGGQPRTAEVAGLPGVSTVNAITFLFAGLTRVDGGPSPDNVTFAGSHRAVGMRLVEGRLPDPAHSGEFVVSRSFVDAGDVALGTRFKLETVSQEQADRRGYEAFFDEGPRGPSLEVTVVGVVDGPAALDDPQPIAVVDSSILDEGPGVALTLMSVGLRPGTSLDDLRAQLDTLPDGEQLGLEPGMLVSSDTRTAVEGQARGLWLLMAVAGVAAVVALGQLITRSVRLSDEEGPRLEALGFDRVQLVADPACRALLPVVTGTILGVVAAAGLSSIFPTGFVRRIEPHPGLRIDAVVLAAGAACVVGALLLWTLAALLAGTKLGRRERPSDLVEWLAVRCRSAALSTGIRFAFTRARRDRGSVRATVAGMVVTVVILVGTVVFGSSLDRLVTDRARFGLGHDLFVGSGADVVPEDIVAKVRDDPDVAAVMVYGTGHGRVGPVSLGLAGMTPVKGDGDPTVLSGRLPSADDEVALGRLAAKALRVKVGDDLTIESEQGTTRFRVTGLAVVPAIEELAGVGQDALLTMGGLERVDSEALPSAAAIFLRPGAPAGTAQRLGIGPDGFRPAVIVNLSRIRFVPYLLAGLVGALALLSVVHVMITSVHHRRRELALLRSLGAEGRWIGRAVRWQATTFSLAPLLVGAPLGLIAGRVVFKLLADSVGAVPSASFPYLVLAAVVVTFVVLANLVAAVPAYRARRLAPAPLLTAE